MASGDLTQLETMLLTQAAALQAMFVDLALRGRAQNNREWLQTHTALALKCAAGSRQAIVALADRRIVGIGIILMFVFVLVCIVAGLGLGAGVAAFRLMAGGW